MTDKRRKTGLKRHLREPAWRYGLAGCAAGLSLLVLAGWLVGSESLVRLNAAFSPTQFNTALCGLLLAAASLTVRHARWLSAACALAAAIFALATASQFATGFGLGIDEIFHDHAFAESGAAPGRMSLYSALVFVCLGLSLACQATRLAGRYCPVIALSLAAAAAGVIAASAIGNAFGAADFFQLAGATGMGVLTLAIAGAIAIVQIARILRRLLGDPERLRLPALFATALALAGFSLSIYASLVTQHRLAALDQFEDEMEILARALETRVAEQIQSFERMAYRWSVANGTPEAHWRADALAYLDHSPLVSAMSVVDARGVVQWAEPRSVEDVLVGLDVFNDPTRAPTLEAARDSGATAISPVFDLRVAGVGILVMTPLTRADGAFDGALVEAFEMTGISAALDAVPTRLSAPVRVLSLDETPPRRSLVAELNLGAGTPIRLVAAERDVIAQAGPPVVARIFAAFSTIASLAILIALHLLLADMRRSRQLAVSNAELAEANAELDSFAYTASHDLKSPLRGIGQLVDWLGEELGDGLSPEAERYLGLIRRRVDRLHNLLNALLDYSRVGRLAVDFRILPVRQILQSTVEMLDLPAGHRVTIEGPNISAATDQNLLQIVIMNLVSNASKHHDGETADIRIRLSEDGPVWRLHVEDDGPGIPVTMQDRVFNMFATLKPRDELEASGMGLAIVQKAVHRLEGRLVLESDPDARRGCQFILEFDHYEE